jgi:uncharacterized protein YjbI with pentapeptide repeats
LPIDVSPTNLRSANFGHVQFERANLMESRLEHARFIGADLRGAVLIGAHLQYARLEDADLGRRFSTKRILRNASFGDANLKGAFLPDANLSDAYLGGADLTRRTPKGRSCEEPHTIGSPLASWLRPRSGWCDHRVEAESADRPRQWPPLTAASSCAVVARLLGRNLHRAENRP